MRRIKAIEHWLVDPVTRPTAAGSVEGVVEIGRHIVRTWRAQNACPASVVCAGLVMEFVATEDWTPEQRARVQASLVRTLATERLLQRYAGALFLRPDYSVLDHVSDDTRIAFDEAPLRVPRRWRDADRLLVPPGPVLAFCNPDQWISGANETWGLDQWCATHTAMPPDEVQQVRMIFGARLCSVRSYAAVALRLPGQRRPLGAFVVVANSPVRQIYGGTRAHLAIQLHEMAWSIARVMQVAVPTNVSARRHEPR